MMDCNWVNTLTRYDCRQVTDLHGGPALEIGTPFSLHDGSAVVLYIVAHGSHYLISDNGDTLSHLSGMGIDVWNNARLKVLRERAKVHGMSLAEAGDFRCLSRPEHAAFMFAKAISGILAVADWGAEQMRETPLNRDVAAEAEPYIVARNPAWKLERRKMVMGASRTEYRFDFLHGPDLIDVISPSAQATGGAMRKVGDVQNGPFADGWTPLVIVDDRFDAGRANQEINILGSFVRAMPFKQLMHPPSALH